MPNTSSYLLCQLVSQRGAGEWLWPGFGENSRVLKWIFERTEGKPHAIRTPIGFLPEKGALDLSGLSLPEKSIQELFHVDLNEWKKEVDELRSYFKIFGNRMPQGIIEELNALEKRLGNE